MLGLKDIEKLANETRIDLDEKETETILLSINRLINRAKWLRIINTDDVTPTKDALLNLYDDTDIEEFEINLFGNTEDRKR